ncbi:sodium channel protein Nach [Aphomia sociella]
MDVRRGFRQYLKNTTLHGFKYLKSPYYYDRVGWILACCASACCGVLLCSELWTRFLNNPTLMIVPVQYYDESAYKGMPSLIAVCPAPKAVAGKSTQNETRLFRTAIRVLKKKSVEQKELQILEDLLHQNRMSLTEGLLKYSPTCTDILVTCRWQNVFVPCENLFVKQLTEWGVCCLLNEHRLQKKTMKRLADNMVTTRMLDLAMNCSTRSTIHGCDLYTKYRSEEGVEPISFQQGHSYIGQLTYILLRDVNEAKIISRTCEPNTEYWKSDCKLKCLEKSCGCLDPLRTSENSHFADALPVCPLTKINCLRSYKNISCECLSSCSELVTDWVLDVSPMKFMEHTIDPLYRGLNASTSIVIHLQVRLGGSRMLFQIPTETWLTLLSSLGGVFNMFLGVGLFSALELLFLLFIKLPIAIKRWIKIKAQPKH